MKLPPKLDPELIEKRSEMRYFVAHRGMGVAEACKVVMLDPDDFAQHGAHVEPIAEFLPTPDEIKTECGANRRQLGLRMAKAV